MMQYKYSRLRPFVSSALLIGAGVSCAVSISAQESSMLEEVTVTAQKREQNLQDVGISISALSGEDIRSFGLNSGTDLVNKIPNMGSYLPYGPGSSGNITLRGIGLNDFGEGHEAPVTLYVDEFYIVSVPAVDFSLFDIERVEVLRGPQGTLFGRNSTGGLVHYVTADPTFERSGFMSLSAGRFGEVKLEGAASGALSDTVAARLSVLSHHSDGYIENLNPEFGDGGQAGTDAIRLQVLIEPDNDWRILLKGTYADTSKRHMYYGHVPMIQEPVTGKGVADPDGTDFAGYNARNFGADEHAVSYTSEPQKLDQDGFSFLARIEKDIGDVTVTSLTGYLDLDRQLVEDCDATPNPICFADFPYESDWFTQEFRAIGSSDSLSWTVGVYYLDQDAENHPTATFNVPVSGPGSVDPVTGLYNGFYFPIALAANWEQSTQSYSAFGQIEYAFADDWAFIAGLRVGRDKKSFVDHDNATLRSCPGFPIPTNCFLPPDGPGIPNPYQGKYSETLVSWRAELDYHVSDDVLLYGSVSQGTKAGGFNNGFYSGALASDPSLIPYDSETNIAYEIGQKSTLLDGRVRLNGSIFYYDYSDFQNFNFLSLGGIVNNTDAWSYGGELELDALISDSLTVNLAIGYLETEIEDVTGPAPGYVADREMAMAPNLTANGAINYSVPLPWGTGGDQRLELQWDWSYIDERYAQNLEESATLLESEFKHNALASLSLNDHWQVQAYIRNISNKKTLHKQVHFYDLGYAQKTFAMPRTYGVTLRYFL